MDNPAKTLREERLKAWDAFKPILDKAEAEGRNLTSEERQELDKVNGHLDELDQRIDLTEQREKRDRQMDETRAAMEAIILPVEDRQLGGSDEERLADWFRGKGGHATEVALPRGATVLRTGGDNLEVRVLSEGTSAAGDALVPQGFRAQLYQHLVWNSAMRQTRATVITTDNGEPLILPKTTAHPTGGIITEGSTITTSDPTFGQGTLNAYKYARLVQISRELLTDSAVDLLGYLAMAFGRALGNASGAHYVTGTGTAQPSGFLDATVGAGTVGKVTGGTGSTGIPVANDIFSVYYSVIPPYRVNAEWFFSDSAIKNIRELKSTTGQFLWSPGGLAGGVPNTLLDKPYVVDPNVAACALNATSFAFGDFSSYFIRDVQSLRFERSDEFAFNTDLVTFRAILRTDGGILDKTGAIGYYVGGTA